MKRTLAISTALVLVALLPVWWFANPIHRSDASIHAWLLRQTPIGTPLADVQILALKRKWFDAHNQGSDGLTSGNFIRGELGEYRVVFVTSVTVFWEFDPSGRLSSIRVWKTTDAL